MTEEYECIMSNCEIIKQNGHIATFLYRSPSQKGAICMDATIKKEPEENENTV